MSSERNYHRATSGNSEKGLARVPGGDGRSCIDFLDLESTTMAVRAQAFLTFLIISNQAFAASSMHVPTTP